MSDALMPKRGIAAAAMTSILAACSGGHSGVLPSAQPTNKPAATSAKTTITVKIPARAPSTSLRKSQFISPSTKSIAFTYSANGNYVAPQAQTANVTPGSPGCATDAGGNTTCTLTFGTIAGTVYYTVTAYDAASGTGHALGVASAQMTVVANQDNPFTITLDGVPSKFTVTPQNASIPAGTPADVPLTISAYDADGNLVVNSPQLTDSTGNPLSATIATNDSTEFRMTQNGQAMWAYQGKSNVWVVNQPFTGIVVHYNGGVRENDTVTFTAASVTSSGTLTLTAPTSSASLVYGAWYYPGLALGGEDASGLTGFPGGASAANSGVTAMGWSGNWAGTCTNGAAESYGELTTDANQNVAFLAQSPCSGGGAAAEPAIVAQAPGASSPAWTITQIGFTVSSFGFDSTNAPYVWGDLGNQTVGGVTADHAQIVALKPGSSGPYAGAMVSRTIDYVDNPETMLVAPDGTVYAAHVGDVGNHVNTEAIDVFAPGANGDANTTAPPARYIGGALTGLASIQQMAFDSKGYLYVANKGNGVSNSSITVYAPGASGNVSPIRTIEGSATQLDTTSGGYITGIGLDAFDNVYALAGGQFLVFPAGASGNVAPSRTFSSGGSCCASTIAVIK